ncbi:hypothetical protein FOXYSP1_16952 [Fusarium oxysporum f. sp. phaseoli]
MEGFMDTMFKDSAGNTFDAPAQPLVNFVIGDCVSVGNIGGSSPPPTAPQVLRQVAHLQPPFYVLATYLGKSTMLEASLCVKEPLLCSSQHPRDMFCPMERSYMAKTGTTSTSRCGILGDLSGSGLEGLFRWGVRWGGAC